MAKSATKAPQFRCTECGWATGKWAGRCGECQSWGTVEEVGSRRRLDVWLAQAITRTCYQ